MTRLTTYPTTPDELKEDLIAVYPNYETQIRSLVDWDHLNSPGVMESFFRYTLNDAVAADLYINQRVPFPSFIPSVLDSRSLPYKMVADRTAGPNDQNGSYTQSLFRTRHAVFDDTSLLKFIFPNWMISSAAESSAGVATLNASIEYPMGSGNRVPILFNGSQEVSMASLSYAVSDPLDFVIPTGGEFYVYTLYENSSGIITGALHSEKEVGYNAWSFANGSLSPSDVNGSTNPAIRTTNYYGPAMILSQTLKPSVALFGTSRTVGSGADVGAIYRGEIANHLGGQMAYANFAQSGSSGGGAASGNFDLRAELASLYASGAVISHGTNDLTGVTGNDAVVIGLLEDLIDKISVPSHLATIAPRSTSTDSWATLGNQTTTAANSNRILVNAAIRAGNVAGAAGYLEVANGYESSEDSGLWKVNYTNDGAHANQTGYDGAIGSFSVGSLIDSLS